MSSMARSDLCRSEFWLESRRPSCRIPLRLGKFSLPLKQGSPVQIVPSWTLYASCPGISRKELRDDFLAVDSLHCVTRRAKSTAMVVTFNAERIIGLRKRWNESPHSGVISFAN